MPKRVKKLKCEQNCFRSICVANEIIYIVADDFSLSFNKIRCGNQFNSWSFTEEKQRMLLIRLKVFLLYLNTEKHLHISNTLSMRLFVTFFELISMNTIQGFILSRKVFRVNILRLTHSWSNKSQQKHTAGIRLKSFTFILFSNFSITYLLKKNKNFTESNQFLPEKNLHELVSFQGSRTAVEHLSNSEFG